MKDKRTKPQMTKAIQNALNTAFKFARYNEPHFKDWCIDQMVRELTGDRYEEFTTNFAKSKDGEVLYTWSEGIKP